MAWFQDRRGAPRPQRSAVSAERRMPENRRGLERREVDSLEVIRARLRREKSPLLAELEERVLCPAVA
ncbi:MAG: hypothetical protein ACPGOY_12605 [Rhodospirillaceae bacterium]